MNFESIVSTSEQSEPDVQQNKWIESILEESVREGAVTRRSITIRNRSLIFHLSDLFGYRELGIAGHTCSIIEQYSGYIIDSADHIEDNVQRTQYYERKLLSRAILIAACSLQLASKIILGAEGLKVSQVFAVLIDNDFYFSRKQIMDTEYEIFASLGFYIPKWNSAEITGLLISLMTEDSNDSFAANCLIQLAEFDRYTIETKLYSIPEVENVLDNTKLRKLHLAAGCAAGALKLNKREKDPIQYLARLLHVPSSYLQCIRDVILNVTILHSEAQEEPKNFLQRESNSEEEASTSKRSYQE